jgi:diguanylate cyclase (GGDEF)-like protein/PAS domain S-box-containing protein
MILDRVMDINPPTVTADLLVTEAIAFLNQLQASCLLVVESHQLVGIFTERDALKAVATAQNLEGVAIADVMNRDVITLRKSEASDPVQLLEFVQQQPLYCLPIVAEQNHIVGLITQAGLLRIVQEEIKDRQEPFAPPSRERSPSIAEQQEIAPQTIAGTEADPETDPEVNAYQTLEEHLRINEQALHLSQNRIESILSSVEDVVWSVAPYTLQLLYINAATEKVYGRSISEFIQNLNLWQDVIHPEDQEWVLQANKMLYSTGRQDLEYRILWPNQQVRWIRARTRLITDPDGVPIRIDGLMTDITERHCAQEQLRHDALHDGLTGLANRNLLKDRLEQALKRNQRQDNKLFAILFLDLDRFKLVNDSLGHQVGDRLLIEVANRFEKCQRSQDTVARLGGDEFVILLEELDSFNDALKITQRIHQALSPPIILDDREIFVTASIGIAFGSPDADANPNWVAEIIRDSDTAMYRAKARGQGCYEVFSSFMHTDALNQMQIETDLRRTLSVSADKSTDPSDSIPISDRRSLEQILVYYQPIFSLDNQRLEGFEALVRWEHPTKGMISPVDFIPIAEETGLIISIDQWVLASACRQLRVWQGQFPDLGPLTMNVNLSSRHFSQPGLMEFLDQIFSETGLKHSALKLEITETTVIRNPETATIILKQLKDKKIHVCLDDFGTGYSSLSYLHTFQFNTLKIDRSFVNQLEDSENNKESVEIVKAIINLGANLGMDVVAEGVETKRQLNQLKALDCQHAQGYWFSKPMSGTITTNFLLDSLRIKQNYPPLCP